MEWPKLKVCKFCDSGNIKKNGFRHNKSGDIQRWECLVCKKQFTANFGFERKQFDEATITGTMQLYFSGMSIREIANHYELMGIKVSFKSIYNWVSKYSKLSSKYLNTIVSRVGNWFRADEVWIKVNGHKNYLFASMDDDTRFWLASDMADTKFQHNADRLLELTKKQTGRCPTNFITDGLPAYKKSAKKVFGKKTRHIADVGINEIHITNNTMERLNGSIRDREKVFRGLEKSDTLIIDGMKVHYNFTRKHGALKGETPSEEALIEIDGLNKWKTIIKNASLNKISQSILD